MRIKYLLLICIAVLFSQQNANSAQYEPQSLVDLLKQTKPARKGYYFWPIFFGGGTFFFSEEGLDHHYPGYSLSGGLTFSMYEGDIFFFGDALYSYRVYDGFPQPLNYRIEETTADIAAGIGLTIFYAGAYIQFPMNTKLRVSEWTVEDFEGLSRTPSFSLMCGVRIAKKHLGMDVRILLGQGPGQFLGKDFGDHWLGQISLGFTGGF
ncbi:MAG: hypothetical protein LBB36_01335 [Fibromonadaceae bacterium]|jgi:hypothetical protein|nr:hypothetical protein [Fibromonadaceae bacterium]